MGSVTNVLKVEVLIFLGALALIVFYQLLTGKIKMRRLLFAKGRAAASPSTGQKTNGFSPSRIQLLIVSIGVGIYMLVKVVVEPSQFPDIPIGLLLLMAGSEAFYLARKANNLLLGKNIRRGIRRNSQT